MSTITHQRDPILEKLDGPRATSWWAVTLITILTVLVLGSLFRTGGISDAGPSHAPVEVSSGIES